MRRVSTSSFTAARRRSTIMTKFRAVQVFRKPPPTVAEHESGSEDGSSDGEGRAGATAEVQRQRQLQRPRPRPHAQSLDEDGLSPTDALAAVMNPSLAKEIMSRRSQHRAAEAAAGGGGGGGGQPPPQQQASQEPVVGYAAVHGRNLRGRGAVGGRDSATTTATTTTRRVRTHVPTPGRRVAWADRVSATAAHLKAAQAAPDGERHEPQATVPAAAVTQQDGHDSAGSSDEVPPTVVAHALRRAKQRRAARREVRLGEGLHRRGVDAARPVDQLRRVPAPIAGHGKYAAGASPAQSTS